MSYSFDLTQERWIPCVMLDGTSKELSLRDALVRAHEIREVLDASPLVTVCLHRLMLAILHRVFGPAHPDEWAEMWEAGRFDEHKLTEYLDEWRHRFDLFDEERPFYQTPAVADMNAKSVGNLTHELSSGNNDTLFDHSRDDIPVSVHPSRAARFLITEQDYATGGLIAIEGGKCSATAAPLVAGALIMATGDTLFQTLLLNLVIYAPENDEPLAGGTNDGPAWEQDRPAQIEEALPNGYLDYLTWQSRRIWLRPQLDHDNMLEVSQIVVSKGRQFPRDYHPTDAMMAYTKREKAKASENPWPAIRLREHRAFWRDSTALFQSISEVQQRPRTLDWIAQYADDGILPYERAYAISVAGLCSYQAKVYFWRHERQPVPLSYLTDAELVGDLRRALGLAEEAGTALRKGLWLLAGIIAAPEEDRSADSDVISKMVDGYPALPTYWSELETRFSELLLRLPGDMAHRTEVLQWWANECVARTAMDAFEQTTRGFPQTPRFLRAMVVAEGQLRGQIYGKAIRDYRHEEVKHAQSK